GIKDCSNCLLPHKRENYAYILKRFSDLAELARRP
ncbi:MAG: metal-binding protein, partial [Clostridia bacterium]|nr:metal-binding protein [Clostridia bacterium]